MSPLLLLDTHVWIWVMEGEEGVLAASAVETIERASAAGAVRVAAISVWEVAMLEARGRLRLSVTIEEWVARGLAAPGTQLIEFTPDISIESTRLPGPAVGDPVDRMLIATARRTGATLVTRDREILAYARSGYLAALDAGP